MILLHRYYVIRLSKIFFDMNYDISFFRELDFFFKSILVMCTFKFRKILLFFLLHGGSYPLGSCQCVSYID